MDESSATKSVKQDETTRASVATIASQTENDGNIIAGGIELWKKTLDANRYATKKTIAQGMLDIALLTANASQLKYILQVGQKHEFYTLMLSLIIISIVLQAVQGILCVFLGSSLNINKEDQQDQANKTNNICLALNIVIVTVNVVVSAFDMRDMSSIYRNITETS